MFRAPRSRKALVTVHVGWMRIFSQNQTKGAPTLLPTPAVVLEVDNSGIVGNGLSKVPEIFRLSRLGSL